MGIEAHVDKLRKRFLRVNDVKFRRARNVAKMATKMA